MTDFEPFERWWREETSKVGYQCLIHQVEPKTVAWWAWQAALQQLETNGITEPVFRSFRGIPITQEKREKSQ